MLSVKNKNQLEKVLIDLESKGIKHIPFIEPDWDAGLTAIGTEPLTQEQRVLLKRYQLWK